jgi:large subunit ribosomal protein L9
MKVILLESTNNVGMVGDVVNVKPGFARNFLIPQGKAMVADESNVAAFEHQKRMMEKRIEKARVEAEGVRGKLQDKEVTAVRRTAKAGKLFGSVTTLDIQALIAEQLDVEVNRKGIALSEPIKKTGSYPVVIKMDGGVEANITVTVEAEEVEEDLQAQSTSSEDEIKAQDQGQEEQTATPETAEATSQETETEKTA